MLQSAGHPHKVNNSRWLVGNFASFRPITVRQIVPKADFSIVDFSNGESNSDYVPSCITLLKHPNVKGGLRDAPVGRDACPECGHTFTHTEMNRRSLSKPTLTLFKSFLHQKFHPPAISDLVQTAKQSPSSGRVICSIAKTLGASDLAPSRTEVGKEQASEPGSKLVHDFLREYTRPRLCLRAHNLEIWKETT
jgi:hypothetical protein